MFSKSLFSPKNCEEVSTKSNLFQKYKAKKIDSLMENEKKQKVKLDSFTTI
jgi:hypothetical protein